MSACGTRATLRGWRSRFGPSIGPHGVSCLYLHVFSAMASGSDAPALASTCAVAQDLTQFRGEGVRIAALAVLATEEPTMVARKDHGRRSQPLGHRVGSAIGWLAR